MTINNNNLRPISFNDVVGQKQIVDMLKICTESAKKRNEALGHVLLGGGPGLGKTSLSTILAAELNCQLQIANGANLRSIKNILPYIMRIKERGILFIDEIHRCHTQVQEFLYPVVEDFRCDLGYATQISHMVPRFTLIGATTNAGLLSQPMLDRFTYKFVLEYYSVDELYTLIALNSVKLNVKLTKEACRVIAAASRGTPRIANNLLRWCRDYTDSKKSVYITQDLAVEALKTSGIDSDGTSDSDNKYLHVLQSSFEPVGIKTLVSMTGIDEDTILNNIEPFLFRMGKIKKTPRGRVLSGI